MKRIGLFALLVVACGGDKKETPAPAPTPSPAPVAAAKPDAAPPPSTDDDDQTPQTRQAQAATAGSAAAAFPRGKDVHLAIASRTAKDKSQLTDEIVAQKIVGAYAANIKRCYRAHVAKDPTSQGSVTLDLTVGTNGKTTAAKATGFPAAEVNACVERQMKVWRFPAPTDKTTPSFEIVVKLTPPA